MFTIRENDGRRWLRTAVLFAAVALLTITITAVLDTPVTSADAACDAKPPGLIGWAYSLTGDAERVDVKGDYAYLVEGPGNLQVFDISDPCNPVSVAYNNTSNNRQEFKDVKIIGDHAYVANDLNGLAKFVATDPSDLNFLKLLGTVKGGWTYAQNVAYDEGPYAFVAMLYGHLGSPPWAQLIVYDLRDFSVKQIYRETSVSDHMWEAYAKGDRVYAAGSAFFRILDVSMLPDMPVPLGGLVLDWDDYGGPFSIMVEGDYAYLGFSDHPYHEGGLVVVNIGDEMNPFVEDEVFISGSNQAWIPPKLGMMDDKVFLAGSDALYGFDVSDPSALTLAFSYPYPAAFGNIAGGGVFVRDNLVLAAVGRKDSTGHGGLAIYKIDLPPTASDDADATNEDVTLQVATPGVLANDSDAGGDSLTAIKVSDPVHGTLVLNANGSFTYDPEINFCGADGFTYKANDGTYDSDVATVSISVTCVNDDPTVTVSETAVEVDESQRASNSGSFDDFDVGDSVAVSASVGEISQDAGSSGAWSWWFDTADGPTDSQQVVITSNDSSGGSAQVTFDLTVNNVAPTIHSLTVPWQEPVDIDQQASFTVDAVFSDPAGANDEPYTCVFDMNNDGANIVTVEDVTGTACSTSLNYKLPGVYTVKVTISDKDGGSASATATDFIVIYDPEGGFVTGGGWIMSPEGACPRCPSSPEGKANFGFVSKYKKGADVPTGNTEFQFHSGDLNFHSSSYDWLVVTGSDYARFKGLGTINGQDEYKFMLWAGDGTGAGGEDTFRIKIWTEDENEVETVVYDNGMDQEIASGSIVVHTK